MKLVWAAAARDDLREAFGYIAEDSPTAAHHVLDRVREAAQLLCDMPSMGRLGRVDGTREWVVVGTPYLIAYQVRAEEIVILHVFQRRGIARALPILDPVLTPNLTEQLREVVEYRKSGLSLNHVIGCPLDCAYCVRHLFDSFSLREPRILLEDPEGVEKVIRAVSHLRKRFPKRTKIATVLRYLRAHRHMMRYAEYREAGLPIGSGTVEAACKTLVTQRMKHGGMRWSQEGGQAILNLRSWAQSDRFDRAWAFIAAKYQAEVHLLANVVSLPAGL